ncbi:hypothetical protein BSKO_05784 [Bryopsis sp. KO-2023]|nr:hypothetical protein BSKO_05784 [Bryopsis sp. KO-2023]
MSSIRKRAKQLSIVHMGSAPKYWTWEPCSESAYGEVARLNRVCWLQVEGNFSDVPPGLYLARWRIKLERLNFNGNWHVQQFREGVDADGNTKQVGVRETCSSHESPSRNNDKDPAKQRMMQLMQSRVGKGWFHLELSVWNLQEGAKRMKFALNGGNPYWCSGLEIDFFELVPFRLDWGVERLLWLGCLKDKDSNLHSLPRNVVSNILKHLAALEAEVDEEELPRVKNCES